jgi:hypothetical protein
MDWHPNWHPTRRDGRLLAVTTRPGRAQKCAENLSGRYQTGRPVMRHSALADRRLQPLGHLSAVSDLRHGVCAPPP